MVIDLHTISISLFFHIYFCIAGIDIGHKADQHFTSKLVEELKSELMSQHQVPTGITQDIGAVVSLMNIMNLSMMALGFRYYDTYMKFMFEGMELTRKEWRKGELSVFGFSSCTVYASFEF